MGAFCRATGWIGTLASVVVGAASTLAQSTSWPSSTGEVLLRDAQLLLISPCGAYAIGRVGDEEIQANDLVRGGMAWRKPGKDFSLHSAMGRVAVRQGNGFLRFYEAETGRFLFERDPENADLMFREEGSAIPVIFALSAGMIPPDRGPYEGEALMSRGMVVARLATGDLVVAERESGRELLRVLPYASGKSLGVSPDGTWGGCEALRPAASAESAERREVVAWDDRMFSRVFGKPGPPPAGVDVAAGPWKIVTHEARDGQAIEGEWSYWLQVAESGRISGRGNLVGLNQAWASGRDRGTWSGLRLRVERTEGRGSSEEMVEGEILRKLDWQVHFGEDGRSFRGQETTENGLAIAIEGQFAGDLSGGTDQNQEKETEKGPAPVNLPGRVARPRE